jgi:hypothetical protein
MDAMNTRQFVQAWTDEKGSSLACYFDRTQKTLVGSKIQAMALNPAQQKLMSEVLDAARPA